jgi:GABA(A) receptor-associated protein
LFLFINNSIFSSNITINSIYDANKNEDGFLYVTYSKESTFG